MSALERLRRHLGVRQRRAVRRVVDPFLAPIGSVRGVVGVADAVALTFDDGPDPVATPAVLDALARAGATATFFVLVERAEADRDLIARVRAGGHEIGLHGIDHTRLTTLAPAEVERRVREGRERLEVVTGVPVRWFRPPFGSQSIATYRAARRAGVDVVAWAAEGADWEGAPPREIAARLLARVEPGTVLLLHDGLVPDPPDAPVPVVDRGEVASAVLEGLAARGVRGQSVGELTAAHKIARTAWFRP